MRAAALVALLCAVVALLALADPAQAKRRKIRCKPNKPCGKRKRCAPRVKGGADNSKYNAACKGKLICLTNGKCGSVSSSRACAKSAKCSPHVNYKCIDSDSCEVGYECTENSDSGYNQCMCKDKLDFAAEPNKLNVMTCNGGPDTITVDVGCGCLWPKFLDVSTGTCVNECPTLEQVTCPIWMVKSEAWRCQQRYGSKGEICIAALSAGCACPPNQLLKESPDSPFMSCVCRDGSIPTSKGCLDDA